MNASAGSAAARTVLGPGGPRPDAGSRGAGVRWPGRFTWAIGIAALATPTALAQPTFDPLSGLEFIRITHPNNPAYSGFDPFGYTTGRGSVGYEYFMARTEVSTGQWLEFFNTFLTREQQVPWLRAPLDWGAEVDPTYTGPGTRHRLRSIPDAANVGAYAVTWRTAAMYCNWLHNGKGSDLASIQSGAYDVSSFTNLPDGQWTDQLTRSAGARYWIPSLDEWLKAAHWDPSNPSNNGWWTYANGSESPATYGPPPSFGGDGTGQANAGFSLPNFAHYDIPLGSYPLTPSIWGLQDLMGMGNELTEGVLHINNQMFRATRGSSAGGVASDRVTSVGSVFPYSQAGDFNLRIASVVPCPSSGVLVFGSLCVFLGATRKRRTSHAVQHHSSDADGGGRSSC